MGQIKIGIVGTSFGAVFIPLFRAHPDVRAVAIADLMPERLQYAQDLYGTGGDVQHARRDAQERCGRGAVFLPSAGCTRRRRFNVCARASMCILLSRPR